MSRPIDAHEYRVGDEVLVVLSMPAIDVTPALGLSEAEREVLREVALGKSNRAIAASRGVSARTVANQIASASRKLGVSGRSELVAAMAGEHG